MMKELGVGRASMASWEIDPDGLRLDRGDSDRIEGTSGDGVVRRMAAGALDGRRTRDWPLLGRGRRQGWGGVER